MGTKVENHIDNILAKGLEKDYWFMTKQTMTDFYFILTIAKIVESYKSSKLPNENYGMYYRRYFNENQELRKRYPRQAESENTYRNSIIAEFLGLFKREKNGYDSGIVTPAFKLIDKYINSFDDVEKYQFIIERQIEKLCLNVNDKIQNYDDLREVTNFPVIYLYKILLELYKRTGDSTLYYDEFVVFLVRALKYSDWNDTVELILEFRQTSLEGEYKNKFKKIIGDVTTSNIRFDTLLGNLSNINYAKKQDRNYYAIKNAESSYRYIENVIEIFEASKFSKDVSKNDLYSFLQSDKYFLGYLDMFFIADNKKRPLECFNVYGIHITQENSALAEDNPHICIGWSYLGDLSNINSKDDLNNLYISRNPDHSPQKRGANVGQIWMFKNEIKINDYVVYFDRGTAHIGKVIGNYEFVKKPVNQSLDYVNNREVQWIKDIAYSDLPSEYRKSSLVQKSVYRLNSYKSLIQDILNGKEINKEDFDDVEDDSLTQQDLLKEFDYSFSRINDGQNLIVYGTPGCGKSYYVEHTLLGGYHKKNYIRTTFFQDYTNTDFVGQILPIVDGEKVTYKFNPGPFTLALEQAIRKPNEKIALVIEELNRGSAASIFGDIFQLLDRKNGVSEYSITNVNIINYLKEQFGGIYTFTEIKIPGNLSIFATMNTSDQNVFTLDTAFKRRWKFKKLINKFEVSHEFMDMYVPGADITWKQLVNDINEYILNVSDGLNSEDKQLGVYFVDKSGMRKEKLDVSNEQSVEDFAYKVLEYLWDDVAKFQREKWFDKEIKSLDQLVEEYKKRGIEVFGHDIFHK